MRVVVIREGFPREESVELARLTLPDDSDTVQIESESDVLKADLEQGVQWGDDDVEPEDGDDFLDAVLEEYGSGICWAEEVKS